MKYSLLLITILCALFSGCSIFPIQTEVKQDHYRFENFIRKIQSEHEYIYLSCFRQRPTGWRNPKQYPAGEQNLWITAKLTKPYIQKLIKEAHFNFKVTLESGKSYMPNREIDGEKISLWIQEVETGIRVSDVLVADLEIHLSDDTDDNYRKTQCESSTV